MKSEKLLELMGNIPDAYILETMERPARRRWPVGRALLAAALLLVGVGAAVAGFQSQLLKHIFRYDDLPPTPGAEAHLVQMDVEGAGEDVSFRVDEYLLDDDRLYLTWTAENRTGKPLILSGPFIEGQGEFALRSGVERTVVGGDVLGETMSETYGATTEYYVHGEGEGLVKVTMLAQEPVAPFVDSKSSSPTGKPVIVWDADTREVESFCYGYDVHPAKIFKDGAFVDDDGSDGFGSWTSASYNYDDRKDLQEDGDTPLYDLLLRDAEADERLGYANLAKRWDLDLTLEKGARRRSLAEELPTFDMGDYRLVITELTQTDVSNRLRFQAVPRTEGAFDDGAPEFRLFVNGADEEPRSLEGNGAILNDGWTFSAATPVDDTPRIAAEEFEWLNDGEPVREIRLARNGKEDEVVDWKL